MIPTFYAPGMMPRPRQPLYFDGTDVSEFLRRWNIECEDFGINEPKKCARLPYYCSKEVKEVVEILDGYEERNWTKLEAGLKEHYWQNDTQRNSLAALRQLIADASNLDLSVYVLKYSSITDALLTNGEISVTQRCCQFLEGLTQRLRDKAFDFCADKDWKLSSRDTGTKSPDFDELKSYILGKARSEKKRIVYDKERTTEQYDDLKNSAAAIVKTPSAPTHSPALTTTTPALTPNSDPAIIELTKQLASLALMVQAQMKPQSATIQPRPTIAMTNDRHCIWFDSATHSRHADCAELSEALKKGLVAINIQGRITNARTGEEIPPMFKRGGMKKLFEATATNTTMVVNASTITLEEKPVAIEGPIYSTLDEGKVHYVTFDWENDTYTDEIVDIEISEKRQQDMLRRQVHPCLDDKHVIPPPRAEDTIGSDYLKV